MNIGRVTRRLRRERPWPWERFPLACTWLVARDVQNYGWLNYVAAVVDDVASGRGHVSLDDVQRFVLRSVLRQMR